MFPMSLKFVYQSCLNKTSITSTQSRQLRHDLQFTSRTIVELDMADGDGPARGRANA
jgi:hypothetical protein